MHCEVKAHFVATYWTGARGSRRETELFVAATADEVINPDTVRSASGSFSRYSCQPGLFTVMVTEEVINRHTEGIRLY